MSMLADPATASVPLGPNGTPLPTAKSIRYNPSPADLQELTSRMPNARRTSFGNYNVQTRAVSRSAGSTYIVTDDPSMTDKKVIDRAEYERVAALQDAYIAEQEMVVVDGYIGNDPEHRSRARLYIEEANANIAGMQQQLYFAPDDSDTRARHGSRS